VGSLYRNPANGRDEVVLADVRHTAVLIGDSQAMPKDSWPQRGISALGYKLHVVGMGGTGFVASNGKTGNYIDALQRGDWLLPYGDPPLIVVQGGGNDATQKATDAQITSNADRLLAALKKRYPGARLAMIGTLARGAGNGGGRRSEVDALLGRIAAKHAIPFVSTGDWLTRYDAVADLQDGVHMKPSGHAKLGSVLARELTALGLTARPDTDSSVSPQ
jgi:acyl-CoA thioesterase-1